MYGNADKSRFVRTTDLFTTQILDGHVTSRNQSLSSNVHGRQRRKSLDSFTFSKRKEPGNQVATTRVLYFFQGNSEVKPLLHWPPVTFISTSLRNCKNECSLSTICSGSQSFPSASARSHSSQ